MWLPSEGRYRELTSCSNYLDYSARRLGTRVKGDGGSQLVHTLNGTACAVSRTLVFLFEHYQEADGGFVVPDVLRPYTGFDHRRRARVAPVASHAGGMPERPNGTVLKTVGRKHPWVRIPLPPLLPAAHPTVMLRVILPVRP